VLYIAIGVVACRRAFVNDGRPDFVGAMRAIREITGGPALLVAIAAGLAGYAIWRWTEAFINPEKRPAYRRADIAIRGAMHGWLGVTLVQVALLQPVDDRPTRHWTDTALSYSLGTWAIFAAGVMLLWFALSESLEAISGEISGHMERARVSKVARLLVLIVSRLGMATRAIVFGLVGIDLLRAALAHRGDRAQDMAEAIEQLARLFGDAALVAVGTGLAAYGVYLIALARWRRMPV
jgi:sulfite exporter TauE/SafE